MSRFLGERREKAHDTKPTGVSQHSSAGDRYVLHLVRTAAPAPVEEAVAEPAVPQPETKKKRPKKRRKKE